MSRLVMLENWLVSLFCAVSVSGLVSVPNSQQALLCFAMRKLLTVRSDGSKPVCTTTSSPLLRLAWQPAEVNNAAERILEQVSVRAGLSSPDTWEVVFKFYFTIVTDTCTTHTIHSLDEFKPINIFFLIWMTLNFRKKRNFIWQWN